MPISANVLFFLTMCFFVESLPLCCWKGEDDDVKSDLEKVELTRWEKNKYDSVMAVYKDEVRDCMRKMCVGTKRQLQQWGRSNGEPRELLDKFASCKADCEKMNKHVLVEIEDISRKKDCHDTMVQYMKLGYDDLAERTYLHYTTSIRK
ncbi:hypothetical protein M514_11610 [Trichuris suis]|uniref:Uncharacterized protein n=1 Tax=Trichuris suis TaxID=68888 RepID=A0A085NS97_9BILA|nr:hypothetical protein M513_11610 [Trichuris suis]KFD72343.1 hypothetical protein M514_11610 [Trichuris suis]KHJ49282.1 hypothetical protein D918_00407 [Trichuris suis]